ncbi:MAG: PAS domain-containing protein [Desulfobacteraceae bacterium]|nr:PAS domain-containing protein [Desulfobacteraceae bacterium]
MKLPDEEIEMILNGIRDFIIIISPERELMEANEAFLKHMGYKRDEVIGRKCYDVFREVTRKGGNCHNLCPLEEVIKNKRHCQIELTRLGPDDETRYTELTIFPIWEEKGKISKFIEISRDVTKRVLSEKETKQELLRMVEKRTKQLQDTHERLLHQDKMASLGKLSSSVVHEINNPVAGILNLVMLSKRILKEDTIDQKEIDLFLQYLNLMETETRRISRIVSNLLVFARQSKIQLKKYNVNKLITQTLLLNSNLLKINKIKVIEDYGINLPRVTGSEDQIKQVCMNIISNAAESMMATDGGELYVQTRHNAATNTICMRFKDSGPGIPRDIVSKIFEPFFTSKKKGKGVGLGLSVVYGIVQEHGGDIIVESDPGKGTVFRVTLPVELVPGKGKIQFPYRY